jgi:hypothetical protein
LIYLFLFLELLAPDTKARIRTKEIFRHPWVMEFEKEYKKEKIEKMQKEEIEKKESISSTGKKIIEDLLKDESSDKDVPFNNKITEKLKIYEKAIEQVTQVSQVSQSEAPENIPVNNINTGIYSNSISNASNQNLKISSKNDQPVVILPQPIKKEVPVPKESIKENSQNLIQEDKCKNNKSESFSILDNNYASFSQMAKENKKPEKSEKAYKAENQHSYSLLIHSNTMNVSPQEEKVSKEKKRTKQLSVSNIEGLLPNTSYNNISVLDDEKNNVSDKNKKYSGMDPKLKEELEEFSILSNPADNLFDKVLNQVQNKNKGRDKKILI